MADEKKDRHSQIVFDIDFNENDIPTNIRWQSKDGDNEETRDCKTMMVAMWDPNERNTLRMDLWTDEMQIDEMHIHFLQTLMTTAESYQKATGNPFVVDEMKKFCEQIAEKTKEWEQQQTGQQDQQGGQQQEGGQENVH